jgi:hypothetical protein
LDAQFRRADRKREQITLALAAVAVLLGASAFGKVAGFYAQRGRVQGVLALAQSPRDPNSLKRCLGEAKKAAETLKQKNLFVKTPPNTHPVKQVEGILGSEAFIAGKWYKVGDKIGDAKIVAINATNVKVEWNGKETAFSPIAAVSAAPGGRPPTGAGPMKAGGPQPPKPPTAEPPKIAAPPTEDDPLAWMGVKLSPKMRALLMQKWNSATPEEREKGKAEWNKMSDEQKQQAVQAMEQRM